MEIVNKKEIIDLIIQITEQNNKKYKSMSKLKTSKCIINEALTDCIIMQKYLNKTKKGL